MSSTRKTPEYPGPAYNLPTGEAAEVVEAVEAVEAAATGAGGAAFGSGAFGDIARFAAAEL
jgi:hypothetical protein